jgi:hypothetical protein
MTPAEAARRNAAISTLRQRAHELGFTLGEIREVDKDTHVELIATAPDGRDFGIGYQKDRPRKAMPADFEARDENYLTSRLDT